MSSNHIQHYHHRVTAKEKAIERHNPGHTGGYPFLGDYKVEKGLAHGHSPRPPTLTHPSYMCLRISGNNVVVDEIGIAANENLTCAIGEVDGKQSVLPQQKNLSTFQYAGQRLSFPDNAKSYCLSTHVKNNKTLGLHHTQLVVCSSHDGTSSRPGTPRNTPRAHAIQANESDAKTLRIRSDPNCETALNISADGNPPLLLPAGSAVNIAAKQELLLSPGGPVDISATLSSRHISLTAKNAPVSLKVGDGSNNDNGNNTFVVQPGIETKISANDALNNTLVLETAKIPELDFGFSLSGDGKNTVFTSRIMNMNENRNTNTNSNNENAVVTASAAGQESTSTSSQSWQLVCAIPSTGNRAEANPDSPSVCVLQFPATESAEIVVAVWGQGASLLQQKIRVPALIAKNEVNTSDAAPLVQISVKDTENGMRKIEATAPQDSTNNLAISVSPDGMDWSPGTPGITISNTSTNPITHMSILDHSTHRRVAQLRLDLPGVVAKIPKWVDELSHAIHHGPLKAVEDENEINSGRGLDTVVGPDVQKPQTVVVAGGASGIARVFETLTPPDTHNEKSLLLGLQGLLGSLKKGGGGKGGDENIPRFSVTYSTASSGANNAAASSSFPSEPRFGNIRCDNAASLSVQLPGQPQPMILATGTSINAPKVGEATTIIASDLAGKHIALLELRDDSNNTNINSNDNTNISSSSRAATYGGGGGGSGSGVTMSFGGDPNSLTRFFCENPQTKLHCAVGEAPPAEIDSRSIVNVSQGLKAVFKLVDGLSGNVLNPNVVTIEGNRSLGSKNLGEFWNQIDGMLMGCPEASNLRSMKPGGDPWLEELLRILRILADPKRTFEIRYRGNKNDEIATVDCGGNRMPCSESQPAKVCISDGVALVISPQANSAAVQSNTLSDPMFNAVTASYGPTADAEQLRNHIGSVPSITPTDQLLQRSLMNLFDNLIAQQRRMVDKAIPVRFSLPRGCAMKNLRCDRPDIVLYATMSSNSGSGVGGGGRRERIHPGESMPPAALAHQPATIEIEAVKHINTASNLGDSGVVVSHFICNYGTDNSTSSGSGGGSGNNCIGFDCEIIPDGEEAIMNLTAPNGYQIVPRVDGLKGNVLGSRGVVRVDATASHVVQISVEDPTGIQVLKQALFIPRVSLPRCDLSVDSNNNGALAIQCPRGIKALASVDGGPEKNMDQIVSLHNVDAPHLVLLKFLGETLSRDGGKEMGRIGELSVKLPPTLSSTDILELARILRDHGQDPSSYSSRFVPRLQQLGGDTKSDTVRDMCNMISGLVGAAGSSTRPPLPTSSSSGNFAAATSGQQGSRPSSRPNTPSIQFRLNGDANADNENVEGGLE